MSSQIGLTSNESFKFIRLRIDCKHIFWSRTLMVYPLSLVIEFLQIMEKTWCLILNMASVLQLAKKEQEEDISVFVTPEGLFGLLRTPLL